MEFRVLGSLEVWSDEGRVVVSGARRQRTLAALLLAPNAVVPLPRLVEMVWEGEPPYSAFKQVRNCVSALREQLGDTDQRLILTEETGYRIRVDERQLDSLRFAAAVADARRHAANNGLVQAVRTIQEALRLWRGPALAGLGVATLGRSAAGWDELRLNAIELCAEWRLDLGEHREVVEDLGGLVHDHPLREGLHAHLMVALQRCGRRAEALAVFDRLRTWLAEELGVDPSADVRRVHQLILCDETESPRHDRAPSGTGVAGGEARVPAARSSGSKPATCRLPPRNINFTGRDAVLRELRERFVSGGDVAVQVVCGLGGVGKTQLSVEYAHRYRSEYRLVVFMDAESPEMVASRFALLAEELGIAEVSAEQVVPRVYDGLRDLSPWLIILDNGEKPSTLVHALPPGDVDGHGHVLVTSRSSGWSSTAGVLNLELFTRRESVRLLTRRIPGITPQAADRIAEHLGDLPLALEQAAGYMDYNSTPPGHYLALLTSRLEDMIGLGELPDRPRVVVANLWQLSVKKLATDRPQSLQLLQLCALLAPEPIPLDMFVGAVESLDAVTGDTLAWDGTVGALAGLGLARRGASSLLLHRLVQSAVRAAMPADLFNHARVELCGALLAAVPQDIHRDPDARPRWQELLPHVLAVVNDEPSAGCAAETATLLRLASAFLLSIGIHPMALPLCERALAIDESLGDREVEVGFDLATLAQIHLDNGEVEQARRMAGRALTLHESSLPADSPVIATDLATLARAQRLLGHHEEALSAAHRALRIDEAAYEPDDPYVSFDLVALASVYLDRGDHVTAEPLLSRALRNREAAYPPDHLYIGYVLLLKARVAHLLNDPTAMDLAHRGALILSSRLGETHPKAEKAAALALRLQTATSAGRVINAASG